MEAIEPPFFVFLTIIILLSHIFYISLPYGSKTIGIIHRK